MTANLVLTQLQRCQAAPRQLLTSVHPPDLTIGARPVAVDRCGGRRAWRVGGITWYITVHQ